MPAMSAWTTFRLPSHSDLLLCADASFTIGTGLDLEQSTILARNGKKGLSSSWEQLQSRWISPDRRAENTVGLGLGSCIMYSSVPKCSAVDKMNLMIHVQSCFHGTKELLTYHPHSQELFTIPPLVLKTRHLSDSAFCWD